MDWGNPLRSIAATVDADVLKALANAEQAVTGNELAGLAGRSYAQVYAVVRRMVDEGLVELTRYGRTNTYRLNRDHVVAQGAIRVLAAPGRIESEVRRAASAWNPPGETVAFIGPAAHRRVSADGELEILVVRGAGVGQYDPGWRGQLEGLTRMLETMSGNAVRLIEVDQPELSDRARNDSLFIESLRGGARVIHGKKPTV